MESRKKRPRTGSALVQLLQDRRWSEAIEQVRLCPSEASLSSDPSPLAVACRHGAPLACIQALLDVAPDMIRKVLDARGTPLHEAIVNEESSIETIAALLQADERLGNSSTRAALLQDVDGFTPLHLLFRRRFAYEPSMMQLLELLVASCPEAVIIPDRGEYEEPPIVYALKSNMYALALEEDAEDLIHEMVACMLRHYPQAASRVFTGYRGQYTALHSAVFHGRPPTTIGLLLQAAASSPDPPALLGNTQGEIPLHFCAMRGERPRSIALIAQAAPQGVLKRDANGLTPFHWLWIRFVGTILAVKEGREATVTIRLATLPRQEEDSNTRRYRNFTSLEQGDSERDLQLIRRMDPPVDFLRMRHIPTEVQDDIQSLQWAERSAAMLQVIRERFQGLEADVLSTWSRLEIVMSLFWTKTVSLLEAAQTASGECPGQRFRLVHTAFGSPCCVPAVARIAATLFPDELSQVDANGRLPIHYAARRSWQVWDWPRADGLTEPTAATVLQYESLRVLQTAIQLSSPLALRVSDKDGCLVLHLVIETFAAACTKSPSTASTDVMLQVLDDLVRLFPESLQRRDGKTKLYPFLQAIALATDETDKGCLSLAYTLLRNNPTLLSLAER